jgi:uncharacterized protein YqjF (DUF2071 family)
MHPLLRSTERRPYPLPKGPWVQQQSWCDVLFAHWPVSEASLRPWVPEGLELDAWEGTPWIAVTALHLKNLRLRGTPPVPGASEVLEGDLRTYVRVGGVHGVLYLTMEASNPLVGAAARTAYHMPYRGSQVTKQAVGEGWEMSCRRGSPSGEIAWRGEWQPSGPEYGCRPDTPEGRLIDQWELFTVDGRGRVYQAGIHRPPWALRSAEARIEVDTFASAFGLDLLSPNPHLCCSKGVEVLVWWPRRVRES